MIFFGKRTQAVKALGGTKICQLYDADVIDKNICRFNITVNDVLGVEERQPVEDLRENKGNSDGEQTSRGATCRIAPALYTFESRSHSISQRS